MSENIIQRVLALLGSLRITVIGLTLLLILTVWGTFYQVDYGLYQAQEQFYQSWYFMVWGFMPFPGAQLVMTVLFINLTSSMLLLALRRRLEMGLVVTHFGLMLMLVAGGVTFYFGKEGHLSLAEGEGSSVGMSYNQWELALIPVSPQGTRRVSALSVSALRPGRTISIPESGNLSLRVEAFHPNCVAGREPIPAAPVNGTGHTTLSQLSRGKQPEQDMPGVIFTLLEDGQEQGRYLVWGGDMGPTPLHGDPAGRVMALRRERIPLPAMIHLVDFRRELHPGSGIAKSYSSQVVVETHEDAERKVLISMNKPLRLAGFTFYQSSFSSGPGGREISTLAVVQNYGRLVPYIATGVTVVGMLLHFTGMLISRQRRRAQQGVPS
jgi:hypothetical protein